MGWCTRDGSFVCTVKGFLVNKMFRFAPIAGLLTLAASAHAAVPTEVTAAVDAMKADGLVIAAAVLVAVIAVAAVKFLRRAL